MASSGGGDHFIMRDLEWAPAEKALARTAFDRALQREFEEIIRETNRRAGEIEQSEHLWQLEDYLTERRKEIDRKYDYRYSVLPIVFVRLVREGRLSEQDLHGLGDDKLNLVRRWAKY